VWLVAITKVQTARRSEDFFVGDQATSSIGVDTDPPEDPYGGLRRIRSAVARAYPDIDVHEGHWTLGLEFGTVLPGETKWSKSPIYVGADHSRLLAVPLMVMAENIPEPLAIPLSVEIVATRRPMELSDLEDRE
jgi:hypothetical protein